MAPVTFLYRQKRCAISERSDGLAAFERAGITGESWRACSTTDAETWNRVKTFTRLLLARDNGRTDSEWRGTCDQSE